MLSECVIPVPGWLIPRYILIKLSNYFGIELWKSSLYGFGYGGMLIVCGVAIKEHKKFVGDNIVKLSITLALFAIFFNTKLFPHDLLQPIIGTIQFPWRVAIMASFFTAILVGKLVAKDSTSNICMVLTLTILYFSGANFLSSLLKNTVSFIHNRNNIAEIYKFDSMDVGAGEYLPSGLYKGGDPNKYEFKDYIIQRGDISICDNEELSITTVRDKSAVLVGYSNNTGSNSIEVPLIYYKGYYAESVVSQKEIPVSISDNGLLEISVNESQDKIKIYYRGTLVQKISKSITIAGAGCICLFIMFSYFKMRNRRNSI